MLIRASTTSSAIPSVRSIFLDIIHLRYRSISPSPRSQALLGNARREALLPVAPPCEPPVGAGFSLRSARAQAKACAYRRRREAELRDWRSQAELGNEDSLGPGFG